MLLQDALHVALTKILVSVGDIICKMFGQTAEEFIEKQRNYEGKEAEFYGRWDNSRPGRREFIIDGPHRKPGPVSSCPAANSSLIDSIQQQMYAAMTLNGRERKQIAEATSSLTADAGAEPYPQPVSECQASERSQPVEEAVVGKDPEDGSDVLQGIMRNLKDIPTRFGLKMVTFRIGQYTCKIFGKTAESAHSKLSQQEGKAIAVYGRWEINRRGIKEFIPAGDYKTLPIENKSSTQLASKPATEATPANLVISINDEVERPTERPLRDAAGTTVIQPTEQTAKAQKVTSESSPSPPTTAAQRIAPADEAVVEKTPEVQGTISKIKSLPTRDGRKMTIFKVGPHNCSVFGGVAEYLQRNASEYEGRLIAVYGDWKTNQRGREEFVPAESIPASQPDPAGAVTADEVQKALEEALIDGSGLRSAGGPTFEEMEAEYKAREERKRSEQLAESSAVAA
jgi:hypothetical protein